MFVVDVERAAASPLDVAREVARWQTERVADLAFDREGALWIATRSGLWFARASGELVESSPGLGEGSRLVRSVAVAGDLVVTGTGDGAFFADSRELTRDARAWHSLAQWLPSGSVSAVAAIAVVPTAADVAGAQRKDDGESPTRGDASCDDRAHADARVRLWLAIDARVHRIDLAYEAGEWRVESTVRAPGLPTDVTPSSLALGKPPREVLAIYPQRLVRVLESDASGDGRCANAFDALRTRGSHRAAPSGGPSALQSEIVRPVLAPGVVMRDLVRTAHRWWLSTDRGLFVSHTLAGPWSRHSAALSAIDAIVADARAGGDPETATSIWLIANSELLRGSEESVDPLPARELEPSSRVVRARGDRDLRRLQQRALRFLSLDPAETTRLARGLRRRAWLPELDLNGGYASDRSSTKDYDESFLSGATRHLRDRDRRSGSDWDVSASFSWDLRDLLYPALSVDFSRETRQVIALRDDVLDEIAQIYYERLGLLIQLERGDFDDVASRTRTELRVEELTAGLDGWTGGWFSAQQRGRPSASDCATRVCGLESNPE